MRRLVMISCFQFLDWATIVDEIRYCALIARTLIIGCPLSAA
jgi:hypothetical protein